MCHLDSLQVFILVKCSRRLLRTKERFERCRLDGLALLCVGVGCFQYILERGETEGWFDSTLIKACAAFAATGIISFIWWELTIPNPIMNLRLFKKNVLRSGTL